MKIDFLDDPDFVVEYYYSSGRHNRSYYKYKLLSEARNLAIDMVTRDKPTFREGFIVKAEVRAGSKGQCSCYPTIVETYYRKDDK